MSIFSYAGNVHFGITVDQGIQACPNAIMDYFHNSFYELAEAAGIELETPAKTTRCQCQNQAPSARAQATGLNSLAHSP